jgi:hypothetical protein
VMGWFASRKIRSTSEDSTRLSLGGLGSRAVRPSEFKRVVYPVRGTSRHRLPPPPGSESAPAALKIVCP